MTLEDIRSVLTFAAFRPDPDDSESTIRARFSGKKLLLLNISKNAVSWTSMGKNGKFTNSGEMHGPFNEIVSKMKTEWSGLTENGWCIVSLNGRFIITLESNLSRKPDSEKIIRNNPRAIVGAKYDRSKRYAIFHNPETSASMLLACEDAELKSIEEKLKESGLKPARICCGLFAMVEDYLRKEHFERKNDKARDFVLIACCDGSVLALSQKKGQWSELRSRSGIYSDDDVEPVMKLATPLLNDASPGATIVLLHDQPDTAFSQALFQKLEEHGANDVTRTHHLWSVLTSN